MSSGIASYIVGLSIYRSGMVTYFVKSRYNARIYRSVCSRPSGERYRPIRASYSYKMHENPICYRVLHQHPNRAQGALRMSKVDSSEFTQFIDRKVRIWYKMNTMTKDSIGKCNYSDMADKFKSEFSLSEKKANEIRHWLVNGWDIVIQKGLELRKAGKPGGWSPDVTPALFEVNKRMKEGCSIAEDEYMLAYQQMIDADKQLFQSVFEKMVGSFFDVFDTDDDGYLNEDDLVKGWACFGIDLPDAVRMIFSEMDTEKHGKIDKPTYVGHWVEFMLGNDQNAPIAKFLCKI